MSAGQETLCFHDQNTVNIIYNELIEQGFTGKKLYNKFNEIMEIMQEQAKAPVNGFLDPIIMETLKPKFFEPTLTDGFLPWHNNILLPDSGYNILDKTKEHFVVESKTRVHFYATVRKVDTVYIIDTLSWKSSEKEKQNAINAEMEILKASFKKHYPNAEFKIIENVYDNGTNNCAMLSIINAELGSYILDKIKDIPEVEKSNALKYIMQEQNISAVANGFTDEMLRSNQTELTTNNDVSKWYESLIQNMKDIADKRITEVKQAVAEQERKTIKIQKQSLEQEMGLRQNEMREFYMEDLVEYLKDLNLIKNPATEQKKVARLLQGCEELVDKYINNISKININSNKQNTELELRDKYLQQITRKIFKNLDKITPLAIESSSQPSQSFITNLKDSGKRREHYTDLEYRKPKRPKTNSKNLKPSRPIQTL